MQLASLVVPILERNPHWRWKDAVAQLDRHKLLIQAPVRRRLNRPEAE
jgi:hypothetical protein